MVAQVVHCTAHQRDEGEMAPPRGVPCATHMPQAEHCAERLCPTFEWGVKPPNVSQNTRELLPSEACSAPLGFSRFCHLSYLEARALVERSCKGFVIILPN